MIFNFVRHYIETVVIPKKDIDSPIWIENVKDEEKLFSSFWMETSKPKGCFR